MLLLWGNVDTRDAECVTKVMRRCRMDVVLCEGDSAPTWRARPAVVFSTGAEGGRGVEAAPPAPVEAAPAKSVSVPETSARRRPGTGDVDRVDAEIQLTQK